MILLHKQIKYHEHFIDFIQFSVDTILWLVQVLNVELDNVAYGVIKHEETRSLLYWCRGLSSWISQVKDWRQDFVHTLYIQYSRVELGINEQDPWHVVIPIAFSLFFPIAQKLLVFLIILPVNQSKLLPSGTCQEWDHDVGSRCAKER